MSRTLKQSGLALGALVAATALVGCGSMPGGSSSSSSSAPAPAPAAAAPAQPKVGPGMNANGEVIDSRKVEAGYGQKVKGIDDWEGEITGKPGPGSKFTQLKIGMGLRQVMDLAGAPTDQGAYMTGKAWIPWYFGSDKHRHELVYKGQGRLIFAAGAGWGWGSSGNANLIWIIHNPKEEGYR